MQHWQLTEGPFCCPCTGAMKGMKVPKGGGKGGRMPQMNMDPAQMVSCPSVRSCMTTFASGGNLPIMPHRWSTLPSSLTRFWLGLGQYVLTSLLGTRSAPCRLVVCKCLPVPNGRLPGVCPVQARMLPPHMLQQVWVLETVRVHVSCVSDCLLRCIGHETVCCTVSNMSLPPKTQ